MKLEVHLKITFIHLPGAQKRLSWAEGGEHIRNP
jgi:hypothetical protein